MGLRQGGVMANLRAHSLTQTPCAAPRSAAMRAASSRRLRIVAGYTLAGSVSMAIWVMVYSLVSAAVIN